MKSQSSNERSPWGAASGTEEDEQLETGEPIPDEANKTEADGARIPAARRRFAGNPQSPPADASTPPPTGQMVLSTAKYLPASAFEPDPKAQKKMTEGESDNSGKSLEGKVFNSGVAGGMLAMAAAALWFVIGLMNDIVFFYPPILFVIGLGAFFKGMMRSE